MRVAVGMSGGVDSTVAAVLLRDLGHEVVGVTMTLGRADEEASLSEARAAAGRLGIPLAEYDFSEAWRTWVLDDLRREFLSGRTPNPCVRCNETVKFSLLPERAFDDGCDLFATGHYARLAEGRLFRAVDRTKDQSYFLYRVRPEILARTLLPLGGLTKAEVRAIAAANGLPVASKGDSQDFCGGDPLAIVAEPDREGAVVDVKGRAIGSHRGYWHYTVGQRKGLGIGGGTPYYVVRIDAERNEVVVGFRETALVREFALEGVVGLPVGRLGDVSVKVRSAGEPRGPVMVETFPDGTARVTCPNGLAGVAPGQSAVFYANDAILGGGIIRHPKA